MPVTYTIDRELSAVHTVCSGRVTYEEVAAHFAQLSADPALPDRIDILLDVSQTTSLPLSQEIMSVSSDIEHLGTLTKLQACAIVATQDAMFGMVRMLEAFTERMFSAINVFRSLDEAQTWLAAERDKRA